MDKFKIVCIQMCVQINLPSHKDYLCSNFKWFGIVMQNCLEVKNVIWGHIAFCMSLNKKNTF